MIPSDLTNLPQNSYTYLFNTTKDFKAYLEKSTVATFEKYTIPTQTQDKSQHDSFFSNIKKNGI